MNLLPWKQFLFHGSEQQSTLVAEGPLWRSGCRWEGCLLSTGLFFPLQDFKAKFKWHIDGSRNSDQWSEFLIVLVLWVCWQLIWVPYIFSNQCCLWACPPAHLALWPCRTRESDWEWLVGKGPGWKTSSWAFAGSPSRRAPIWNFFFGPCFLLKFY